MLNIFFVAASQFGSVARLGRKAPSLHILYLHQIITKNKATEPSCDLKESNYSFHVFNGSVARGD